jgi:hypothetical protein
MVQGKGLMEKAKEIIVSWGGGEDNGEWNDFEIKMLLE